MILKDFLAEAGTEKNLARLIIFLSEQAGEVRKGFLSTCMNKAECETRNIFGEDQKPLDKYADDVFINALKASQLVR
jgi:fructose-1,6-bisphosphatase I